MLTEASELARYYSVADTARCLGLPEARVRDWQLKKFIAPVLTKGRIQFARADVARMFVLDQLQAVFGQTAIATAIAQALQPADLEELLDGNRSQIEVVLSTNVGERKFIVTVVNIEQVRERMAAVPR